MSVLIVLYDGFTEFEYQIPVLALHHLGIPFEAVGLDGPDVTGMIGLRATTTRTLAEVDPEAFSALLLPGVDRAERERVLASDRLMAAIRSFGSAGKPVVAVCAAPTLLGRAGVLRGRRFCSDLAAHPAFEHAIRVEAPAVRDGHVITGLGSRIFYVTALLIEALAGEEHATAYRSWAGIACP